MILHKFLNSTSISSLQAPSWFTVTISRSLLNWLLCSSGIPVHAFTFSMGSINFSTTTGSFSTINLRLTDTKRKNSYILCSISVASHLAVFPWLNIQKHIKNESFWGPLQLAGSNPDIYYLFENRANFWNKPLLC